MQASDFQAFRDLLNDVYTFYGKDVSQFAADVWWQALRPYALDAVRKALNRHVTSADSGQWLPKPADVVRLLAGGGADRSQLAWSTVDRAVRCVGGWQSVVFDDPAIHAAIDGMGGWVRLCSSSGEDWPFKQREFETRYRGLLLRGEFEYPRKLIGMAESQNAVSGHASDVPLMIGDESACRAVYLSGRDGALAMFQPMREVAPPMLKVVGGVE